MTAIDELLGQSRAIATVRKQVSQLLSTGSRGSRLPPILLQGETGTGKGLLARLLHRGSTRGKGPFVDVSCAAIPENLLEAELFGYERGAFTDARRAKVGLIQAANLGSFFLDELALLPGTIQAKLLKAVEDRAVRRLGGTRAEPVDVQFIAASNEDLGEAVRTKRFRDDLYQRLAVVTLTLPSLRERPEDILLLAEHFLRRACAEYRLTPQKQFSDDARAALQSYVWPGNVRELGNVIERTVLMAEGVLVTASMLELAKPNTQPHSTSTFDDRIYSVEREQLRRALEDSNGNVSAAAIALGISRSRMRYRLEKHGLHAERQLRTLNRDAIEVNDSTPTASAALRKFVADSSSRGIERRHVAFLRVQMVSDKFDQELPDCSRIMTTIAEKIRLFGGVTRNVGVARMVGVFGADVLENAPSSAALAALAIQNLIEKSRRLEDRIPRAIIEIDATRWRVDEEMDIALAQWEQKSEVVNDSLANVSTVGADSSILVSAAAFPFLERRFEFAQCVTCERAGPIYRLFGQERTGFGLGGRPLVKFVGRQRELETIEERLVQAARGFGQIFAIVGEPGVGKSRLIYEQLHAERMRDWKVLSCRALVHGSTTPLLPIIDLLKMYFGIQERDDGNSIQRKVTDKLIAFNQQIELLLTPILSLFDLSTKESQWERLDPVRKRLRTFDACKRIFLREAHSHLLLLVFEDLHWIDSETQAFLDILIDSLPSARALVLVSYRPEYQHQWGAKNYYTQLRAEPLNEECARGMLKALLGDHASLDVARRPILERTEGNPLFLEESVRALVETGALQGDTGAYQLIAPLVAIEVPVTVEAILAARINRLDADVRLLLQTAAVIGKDLPYMLLHALVEVPEELLHLRLRALQGGEFLYEKSLFPDREYTFKHALTHEVAYNSLQPARRIELHACIVESIERLYPDRISEHLERLAHHAFCGELWEKALVYSRSAGEKAIRRSANREAWSHVERAIQALSHLPRTKATMEQAIDLRLAVRTCLSPLGEFARALELGHEALAFVNALNDPRRQTLIHCSVSISSSHMGNSTEAIEHGRRALEIAEALQESALRISARHSLGVPHWFRGDFRTAINCFQREVGVEPGQIARRLIEPWQGDVFQGAFAKVSYSHSLANSAYAFAELGEFDQALLHAKHAVSFAKSLDILYLRAIAEAHLGAIHLLRGNEHEALVHVQHWIENYGAADLSVPLLAMTSRLAEVLSLSGHPVDALALFDRAWRFVESKNVYAFGPRILALLGDAYSRTGKVAEAWSAMKRALALADQLGQRADIGWILFWLGNHCDRVASFEQAGEHFQRSLEVARELTLRPLQARCLFALGKNAKHRNLLHPARDMLGSAASMFREMSMQSWLGQTEDFLNAE